MSFHVSHASFFLNPRDQQPPLGPQLREAEPHGGTAQPEDPAGPPRRAAQRRGPGPQPSRQPTQPRAPPEPRHPAARPPTSDLHPREQVRHRCLRMITELDRSLSRWRKTVLMAAVSSSRRVTVSNSQLSRFSEAVKHFCRQALYLSLGQTLFL